MRYQGVKLPTWATKVYTLQICKMLDPRCGAILDGHDLNKLESQQYRDDFVGKDENAKSSPWRLERLRQTTDTLLSEENLAHLSFRLRRAKNI